MPESDSVTGRLPTGTGSEPEASREITVVYLGPTLPVSQARDILPDAIFLPPIAQGDLLSLATSATKVRPRAVGIVDGVFFQSLPVWHKEILLALEMGIQVFGASSMGALRAAECDRYGMVGVGEIYRRFASGELTDDDEVALAHDGPETGWRGHSEPLVNVRATLESGVLGHLIDGAVADLIIRAAKNLWFPERTLDNIFEAASYQGVSARDVAVVRELFSFSYVDLKKRDAVELLQAMGRVAGSATVSRPVTLERSTVFEALAERDRQRAWGGSTIRDEEIARHVALSHPGFATLRDRGLDRMLLAELADVWRVEVAESDVDQEAQRIRSRLGIYEDEQAFGKWCADNDLSKDEWDDLIRTEARIRRLRDWIAVRQSRRLVVAPILTELRMTDEYRQWSKDAADHCRAVDSILGDQAQPSEVPPSEELILDQMRCGSWRPDVAIDRFAGEAGFSDTGDLLEELSRRWAVRQARRNTFDIVESLFDRDEGAAGIES